MLTRSQSEYLAALASGADIRRWNGLGGGNVRASLERRGFIRRRPMMGHGGARWELTDAGRAALSAIESKRSA